MRLDKYLTLSSAGTRKKVHALLAQGRIQVNGAAELDATRQIDERSDQVMMDGVVLTYIGRKYYMMNKPAGCITAKTDTRDTTVMDYFYDYINIEEKDSFFPVGRLDKNTTGLLLITNDGELCHQLMMPQYHVAKTYELWALGTLDASQIRQIEQGLRIAREAEALRPARIEVLCQGDYRDYKTQIDKVCFPDTKIHWKERDYEQPVLRARLTITEGKKHQVKRMMRAVGCTTISLKRIAIGELKLDEQLKAGAVREIAACEMSKIAQKENLNIV